MSENDKPPSFVDNLESIMGANQDMLSDVLADLYAVMPKDQAEAMARTLLSIQSEYESDMTNLIEKTRADGVFDANASASADPPEGGDPA